MLLDKKQFIDEVMFFSVFHKNKDISFVQIYEELGNDVDLALEVAYSNFRTKQKGFWARLLGGRKEVNLFKYK